MAYFTDTSNGIISDDGALISYSEAVMALESGQYDKELLKGLYLAAAVMGKLADEPETLTPEQRISVWRWVVATCFIRELQEKNGTTEIRNEEGGVDLATIYSNGENALTIYPASLRLCLASHFESIFIEELGGIYKDYCPDFIIKAYIGFLDISLEHGPRLSEKGREGLCILHDDYIRELEANNGFLAMPTMH
ncbi:MULTISPECIES: hypothetical protein [Proteus]|uniref:hypothetical protein n=1 Tax=Proteus TaxID=583 RepID=UPI0013E10B59|nr:MULTISPECIES: hypothetical protein [Proteus]QIG05171.1 hypothetical protein GTK47_07405 [Proteus sp. ZN5]